MKAQDIRIQAQLHIGMPIESALAIKYLNEGMVDLSNEHDTSCIREEITIDAIKDTWYNLDNYTNDFLDVRECTVNGDKYNRFRVIQGRIKFVDDGNYILSITRYPNSVTVETDIPETPKAFHYALAYYVASKYRAKLFGGNDPVSLEKLQEYKEKSFKAHAKLSSQKRTARRVKARPFV